MPEATNLNFFLGILLIIEIEWDSVAQHQAHLGTDLEKQITGIIWPLIDTSRSIVTSHIPFDPSVPSKCFEAPIVEICIHSNVQKIPGFEERIVAFEETARKEKTYRGMLSGWKLEEGNEKDFFAVVGWSSLDDHVKVINESPLVEEVEKIRELSGDAESHHVVLTQWVA